MFKNRPRIFENQDLSRISKTYFTKEIVKLKTLTQGPDKIEDLSSKYKQTSEFLT